MDCGPSCLLMVAKSYGRTYAIQTLRDLCQVSRDGVSLLAIGKAAEKIGFRAQGVKLSFSQIASLDLPCILYWNQSHFVVLYKVKRNKILVADPLLGIINYTEKEFCEKWIHKTTDCGLALILSTTPEFYRKHGDKDPRSGVLFIFKYLTRYRQLIIQLGFAVLVGVLLQLIAPFLTRSVVDIGINNKNLNFIYLILIAQIILSFGKMSMEFIRSWILLHISTRINISILTDFLIKLMKLPMSFFDVKMTGDIMQRINDQKRIESFLTGPTLSTFFSLINLVVFSFVIAYYSLPIFIVFSLSSILYFSWIIIFLNRRRVLDYKTFDISAKNQSNIVQLVNGMQEIKLNNCEQEKRWEWEDIQARLFRFNIKGLALSQYQQTGATFINESKNIIIIFLSAKSVIDGTFSLGTMMAIQYIIGQLNGPVEQLIGFVRGLQDARISVERLNEIYVIPDEEQKEEMLQYWLPEEKTIQLKNVIYSYPGSLLHPILKNINLNIPQNKTTAIVGASGSGKTTLLKLLLRFYDPASGDIHIGNTPLKEISSSFWRSKCGVVMQDGFIFSDTIEKNIAITNHIDRDKLMYAATVANLLEFIDSLPLKFETKIGMEGNGISQGQRQRILIARAIYKDPQYVFFDEATNALDSENEAVIMNNLQGFLQERTVVVVAHRLSTVRMADNIIVLDKGRIIENGTHTELIALKGSYFTLVKNQLELGA